jgi:ribosome-binding factor A
MARSARTGKAPSQRQLRVGELVRHALSEVLLRGDVRNPELQGASITVTEARMSPDLRLATVFFVPLGGGDAAPIQAALERSRPFLRARVAEAVDLKFAPDLRFAVDASFEEARRVDALLHSPQVARDLARDESEDETG